ncbi:hypothetical protein [Beijerinckia indica]|uniref:Uncharacterized protein n=1 Tax=Beijerinckia indica subsp. indica (strain ATCC 9039 / DSM 1715 / NCIMB 8712) TaxID=395963 RepID=B2ILC2_BEII9|nr:hypothetical protein [Beijerinckia indica]ACB97322.1 hypothetical protein Bind_3776 [Beijerinckia indica subsp. indica ATCC 9039]
MANPRATHPFVLRADKTMKREASAGALGRRHAFPLNQAIEFSSNANTWPSAASRQAWRLAETAALFRLRRSSPAFGRGEDPSPSPLPAIESLNRLPHRRKDT